MAGEFLTDDEMAAIEAPKGASGFLSDEEMAQIEGDFIPATYPQAAEFTGKSFLSGAAKLGDLGISAAATGIKAPYDIMRTLFTQEPSPVVSVHPLESALRYFGGSPDSVGLVKAPGSRIDVPAAVQSTMEATSFPGGPVLNAATGLSAELGHQAFPESKIAPFLTALAPGLVTGLAKEGVRAGSRFIGPQTERAALSKVGEALSPYASTDELAAAIKAAKKDSLAPLQSSAELLQSPELAIIEQNIGSSSNKSIPYAADVAARKDAEQFIIDQLSKNPGAELAAETTGATIQQRMKEAFNASKEYVSNLYEKIPLKQTAEITPLKYSIGNAKNRYFGPGSPPVPSDIQGIIDYVKTPGQKELTIRELQNLRSHIGDIARDAPRGSQKQALATSIHDSLAKTIESAPQGASEWRTANDAYREHAQLFKQGPLSKVEDILPSRVFDKVLSSPEASKKFATIAQSDPAFLSPIKDQIASDLSKLSDIQKFNFIKNNQSQLKTLLQDDYSYLDSLKKSIGSRIDTQKLANATRGSNTALKLSSVIERAMSGKPVNSGISPWAKLIGGGGAIGAAMANPIVAIPAIAAGVGINALKNRSASLIENALFSSIRDPKVLLKALQTANPAETLASQLLTSGAKAETRAAAIAGLTDDLFTQPNRSEPAMPQAASSVLRGEPTRETIMPVEKLVAPEVISAKRDYKRTAKTLMKGLIQQESGGKNGAISSAGAQGLTQLMPETGREQFEKLQKQGKFKGEQYDPFDEDQNVEIGTAYLAEMLEKFNGDIELALTAYNQGPNRVKKLLAKHDATTLDEIIPYLGKDGRSYARLVLAKNKSELV